MNLESLTIFVVLYIILNGITFFLYGIDKRKAVKDKYRIRESTLIWTGLLGPFGALAGMKTFRHKTQKSKFKSIYLFVVLHIVIIAFFFWKFGI